MKKTIVRSVLAFAAAAAVAVPLIGQVAPPPPVPQPPAATQPATKPVNPDAVVITVGEEKITAKDFDDFLKAALQPQYQALAAQPGPIRREIADNLVKMKLMVAEAKQRKLDETPDFKRQLDMVRENLLANALAQDVVKNVDEKALQEHYDKHNDEYARVKARHILVRTKGSPVPAEEGAKELTDAEAKVKADAIRLRLDKEDFATVAKAESADKYTPLKGGESGTVGRGQLRLPEFDQAAFSIKEGEISQPFKTDWGYHILQVQERKTPPFEEMKKTIEQQLGPERLQKLTEELKAKYKPTVDDGYFGPPGPATPDGPMP